MRSVPGSFSGFDVLVELIDDSGGDLLARAGEFFSSSAQIYIL